MTQYTITPAISAQSDQTSARDNEATASHDLDFRITSTGGPPNQTDAYLAMRRHVRTCVPVHLGHAWESISVSADENGYGTFTATVRYSKRGDERKDRETPKFSGSTSGNTAHITTALSQTAHYADGWEEAKVGKLGNGINLVDGEFQGVDVVRPKETFKIDIVLSDATFSRAFYQRVLSLTGCTNASAFDRFGPNELLFLGINYSSFDEYNEDTEMYERWWNVSFDFEVEKTVAVQYPGVRQFTKRGWDYIWVLRKEVADNAGKVEKKIVAAYTSVCYPTANFSIFNF